MYMIGKGFSLSIMEQKDDFGNIIIPEKYNL